MPQSDGVLVLPVVGIGEVVPGTDLARLIAGAVAPALPDQPALLAGDVVVVTQKIVSKAEGKLVPVDHADAGAKLALVEQESVRILRRRGDLVITETRHGFVCANAGVDLSKLKPEDVKISESSSGRSIRMTLPPSEVFVTTLDNEHTRVYARSTGLLVPVDQNLESETRAKAQEQLQKAALSDGILDTARKNARATVMTLLYSFGFTQVDVQ